MRLACHGLFLVPLPLPLPTAFESKHGAPEARRSYDFDHARRGGGGSGSGSSGAGGAAPPAPVAGGARALSRGRRHRVLPGPALGGRLGGGQDAAAGALHPGRVRARLQVHHRRRVPDAHAHAPPQARQGADLGHRRPGEDTLVTNPEIPLESILFSVIGHNDFDESPDLVLTEDFGGVNAGVFFIRRSKWSQNFLDTWWNQTSFIQFGSTRSGDNAALKHLIDHLSAEEMQEHVRIAKMQCLFNSYPWTLTFKSVHRLIFHLPTTWKGVYSDGDFMIHFAGLDDKQGWTNKILREGESQR